MGETRPEVVIFFDGWNVAFHMYEAVSCILAREKRGWFETFIFQFAKYFPETRVIIVYDGNGAVVTNKPTPRPNLEIYYAPDADEEIIRRTKEVSSGEVIVVTQDEDLRREVEESGVFTVGSKTLRMVFDQDFLNQKPSWEPLSELKAQEIKVDRWGVWNRRYRTTLHKPT